MAKPPTAKRTYKLDIGTVMEAADKGKREFYTNLTDEEKKSFVPVTAQRWLSDVRDRTKQAQYILNTNTLVNPYVFTLTKHHELLWLLMSVVGCGTKQYHGYIPTKSKRSSTKLVDQMLSEIYPYCNEDEWNIVKSLYTNDDLIQLAKDMSKDDKFIKDLTNEIKKISE